MDEPATEMDEMDSVKASRGLNLGLKKAMASDLDRSRYKPLFRYDIQAEMSLYLYYITLHYIIDISNATYT